MRSSDDILKLKEITKYLIEINGTIKRFDLNFDKFNNDYVAKHAIAMCILQIGELAGKLSDEFKLLYDKIPWRNIIATRNRIAHDYINTDISILWDIASNYIPELKASCKNILEENE